MSGHFFAWQDFKQSNKLEAIMEVSAEVINNRVSLFEVFVGPSGKGNYNYNLIQFISN